MKFRRYESRSRAGEILAEFIQKENEGLGNYVLNNQTNTFCFAIPNGGVPISEGFCSRYKLKYDLLIVRKIKIPHNTEAGFGAVTTDGTVLLNKSLLSRLNLSENAIQESIELTKEEISTRLEFYDKLVNLEKVYGKQIQGKFIFILDDGLASGFTMMAAVSMIKKYLPAKVIIAVPTAPLRTVLKMKDSVDEIFCPNIRDVMWFAVADAYSHWYDVPESEVLQIINNSKQYISNIGTT